MPNWCSNNLVITPTNESSEALAQLKQFVSDVSEKGQTIELSEAEAYREKFLEDNFNTRYADAAHVFVLHGEMSIERFMEDIAYYSYDESKKQFTIGASNFSMNNLLPVPMELLHPDAESYGGDNAEEKDRLRKELENKFGFKSWYDWRIAKWGCKWDIDSEMNDDTDCKHPSVTYNFDTAWAPPSEFLMNICERYPLLNFSLSFSEPGGDFEGELEIEAGEVTNETTRPYSGDDGDEDDEEFEEETEEN